MLDVRRREFIALLGGAAAWPLAARAQQTMPVIGFLNISSPGPFVPLVAAFRQGLNDEGFVEGSNVAIEYRFAENQPARLPALVAELIARRVTVIAATGGTVSGLAAKAATTTIPIVFTTGDDPVKVGLVPNLNRPGGNLTGISVFNARLGAKRLGLLHELIPAATSIAFLANPKNPETEDEANDVREAARMLGIQILVVRAGTESELDAAFATIVEQRAAALMVASDTYFDTERNQIAALVARHSLLSIVTSRAQSEAGGVIGYGTSIPGVYRQAGGYVGRILKGAKPADLPVPLPTTYELIINLKTAKALGLEIPPMLLARADEVIE
jgi:putative tryptophan/tyrosine transport system substrate-binding protein